MSDIAIVITPPGGSPNNITADWSVGNCFRGHPWSTNLRVVNASRGRRRVCHTCRLMHRRRRREMLRGQKTDWVFLRDDKGELRRTHCRRGHLFTPETTFRTTQGRSCRLCRKINYDLTKDRIKERNMQRLYGMSDSDYQRMLDSQGGVCAICREPDPWRRRLSIDHDHSTGAVRGLLCTGCNNGLGRFRDNADLMERAIEYLREAR